MAETGTLPADCDLLVVGSGAGGLGTAVVAAQLGLRVVVVEKEAQFGGTTAWSGGWMWVPRNPLAVRAGIVEPLDEVRRYLHHVIGAQFDEPRIEAFLAHAPAMLQWHLEHGTLGFVDGNAVPDFHGHAPGARSGGRSVCAAPFDAARLGPLLPLLKPPHPLMSFLGMSIGGDLRHFLRANRALDSAWYVGRRIVRHLWERATLGHGRLRLGGNAMVAALLCAARERGVTLLASHAARSLRCESGRVLGAVVASPGGERSIAARRGVVLACGGFPHDPARLAALFPHAPTGHEHHSAAPAGNTGDGLRLGEASGARWGTGLADAGAWAPVSRVPHAGGMLNFPHLVERGKPGLIAVDARGERFVDEAGNYHSFMRALFAKCRAHPDRPVEAWLLCDARFIRRYGLGAVRPWPFPHRRRLADGYLKRGRTPRELAQACGIDADGLVRTLRAYNEAARAGTDPAFDRGGTPYDRMQGDAEHHGPNPCVAPLERGPFYAVRIVPGSLGTFAGLAVNQHAQALDAAGAAIPGLYAAGNDMASVMGGHYPSGGITLGPALTFAWLLAHHAAGRPLPMPAAAQTEPTLETH